MDKLYAMKLIFVIVAAILILENRKVIVAGIRRHSTAEPFTFNQQMFDLVSWIVQILFFVEIVIVVQSINPSVSTLLKPLREMLTIDIGQLFPSQKFLGFVLSLILFFGLWDFFQYWTHRLLHYGRFYDVLHRFHHGTKMYVLTTFRHHPLEILFVNFTITIPTASIYAIVFPSGNFTVFWHLATIQSLLLHSNLTFPKIPIFSDLIFFPNHHHLHHQLDRSSISNFGQYFTVWDRLFGTYEDPYRLSEAKGATGNNYSAKDNFNQLFWRWSTKSER